MAIDHVNIGGVPHYFDAKTIEGDTPEAAVVAVTGSKKKIKVTTPLFSSLPVTFSANGMTAQHELEVEGYILVVNSSGQPFESCKSADWRYTTEAGTLTITGTFLGTTAARVIASFDIPTKVTATTS